MPEAGFQLPRALYCSFSFVLFIFSYGKKKENLIKKKEIH